MKYNLPSSRSFVVYRLVSIILLASALCRPAFAALQVENSAVTNITRTTANIDVTLFSSDTTNPVITVFYGMSDGLTNAGDWSCSNVYGVASITGLVTMVVSNLTPASLCYYRALASETTTNATNVAWSSGSSNWVTVAGGPTNLTTSTNWVSVTAPTNGPGISPANIFLANSQAIINAIGYLPNTSSAESVQANLNIHEDLIGPQAHSNGTMSLESTNNYTKTADLGSAAFTPATNYASKTQGEKADTALQVVPRYFARTNASETVEVFATASGIVATRTNSTFYFNIPAGAQIHAWQIRVDGSLTDGGKIYLVFGTNDVNNSSVATGWNTTVDGFREDWNAKINPTALPSIADPTQTVISGLPSTPGVISHIRGGM